MNGLLDLDAIRREHPLATVAGAIVKLRRRGDEYEACCPFHGDRSPSFTIYSGGNRFQCFGCGAQGDVLDFGQRLHGVDLRGAAAMLFGGELPTMEVAPVLRQDEGDRLGQVREIWRNAWPAPGTLAETYLRWRGLDLPIPESVRFARLQYGKKGRECPCLVACIAGPDNRLCLTLQQELGRAVWVSAGTAMLPAMQFPGLVRSISIGGDGNDPGRAAAAKAAKAFAARGLRVRTFFPTSPHKDFNDELQGVPS